ncbi:MAG: dipeptidase [Bacteroidetes bacterium]|nr:dipeptidase [Bacteroidota bacterium]
MKKLALIVVMLLAVGLNSEACTNYLITKGASVDGSTMISYAADSHVLYGELYHWPAAKYAPGTMVNIYEWDTGKHLGQIEQALETYNVTGNMNEFQLAIGETTYGGRKELAKQDGAIMDYGSLIYTTLQRAKTAREAIKTIDYLMQTYGYYSSGESFSIADKNEVWIMELIGKGNYEKGAVWVAMRIPDGYVSGHANQARIMTFDYQEENKWDDPEAMVFNAKDVISFAKDNGFYEGKDKDFAFSEVYAPVDFSGARFCDIRVWSMFNKVTDGMDKYWEYAKGNIEHKEKAVKGKPLTKKNFASNRMPLWVKPNEKVSVKDMMNFMRDHLEGTELDMSKDFGAGPNAVPYRWRPLTWKVDGVQYCNERATATQQTAFSFVSQSRDWLPDEIGGIIWWGLDDASSTVYTPLYSSMTRAPKTFAQGNGALMEWSDNSAFWVFSQVANYAYTRYNLIHPEVEKLQSKFEAHFIKTVPAIDAAALKVLEQDRELALHILTSYSVDVADNLTMKWKKFYQYLFMKYHDGNMRIKKEVPEGYKYVNPDISYPGYSKEFYEKLVKETGDKLKVVGGDH